MNSTTSTYSLFETKTGTLLSISCGRNLVCANCQFFWSQNHAQSTPVDSHLGDWENMDTITAVVVACVAAVVAAFAVTFVWRRRARAEAGALVETELAALREAKATLERRLAVEEEKSSRLPALEAFVTALRDAKGVVERELAAKTEAVMQGESTLADLRRRLELAENAKAETQMLFEALKTEKAALEMVAAEKGARLEEKNATLEKVSAALTQTTTSVETARARISELVAREARLQETLDQEKNRAEERLALLNEARAQMSSEFKVLAEEVMKNHGDTFSKQNREQITGLLTPLRDKLAEFQHGLQSAHTESVKERAALAEQIRNLNAESARMSGETHNLTQALKGKTQTQGAWGEMILSTILERSGLREGEEYIAQESHTVGEGARLRPDVVVNLPGGQRIVVDSKVSLTAFEAYVGADNDAVRLAQTRQHVNSLRTHIRSLGTKEYHTLTGDGLDYVIMFVPIEGALALALQEEPGLTAFAAENNVAIATPTTLMIALRTVANVWRVERRNRNAETIAKRAGLLYDKFSGFVGDLEGLGDKLRRASESYDAAMGKLASGRGNLIMQVEQLKELGAKTSKSLPKPTFDDDDDADGVPTLPVAGIPQTATA